MPPAKQPPPGRRLATVEVSGHPYRLWRADPDALLDDLIAQGGDERFIPYWADLWPSAAGLAQWLARHPEAVAGRNVFELGCGLGLSGVAAARLGARRVVFADLLLEAADMAVESARLNGVADRCEALRFDWQADAIPPGVDVVIAADILYERTEHPWLSELFAERLGGAELILADPWRTASEDFFASPRQWKLKFSEKTETVEAAGKSSGIKIFRLPAREGSR